MSVRLDRDLMIRARDTRLWLCFQGSDIRLNGGYPAAAHLIQAISLGERLQNGERLFQMFPPIRRARDMKKSILLGATAFIRESRQRDERNHSANPWVAKAASKVAMPGERRNEGRPS